MLALLGIVFWITIEGANFPSELLADGFFRIQEHLSDLFIKAGAPYWLHDILIHGMYRTMAWVVSVMLPPMAIFFPLFTLLEDPGYLRSPSIDNFFKGMCPWKAGADHVHGIWLQCRRCHCLPHYRLSP